MRGYVRLRKPHATMPGTAFIIIGLCLCLTACGTAGTAPAPATLTPVPTWTPTTVIIPTATLEPTKPPAPTPENDCSLSQTLREIRTRVPYEEFAVHQNQIGGTSTLAVWFVDPALDAYANATDLPAGVDRARQDAAELTDRIRNGSRCVAGLFDKINTIVVDSSYSGWLSVEIAVLDVLQEDEDLADRLHQIAARFVEGYVIEALPAAYRPGVCGWAEAEQRLWTHFSAERSNVAFYFVVDRNGPNVWTQWDGPTDPVLLMTSIGNILLALECFTPDANLILIVVDSVGEMGFLGYIPQMRVDQMQVLYSQ
ncbi:MAG: hypothetical protein JXA97_09965 [Anaerolineales bacterium]|nr:hypothetical protein [Anaerolineales bacterium]